MLVVLGGVALILVGWLAVSLIGTILKLGLTVTIGSPAFRRVASTGLVALGLASLLGLWVRT